MSLDFILVIYIFFSTGHFCLFSLALTSLSQLCPLGDSSNPPSSHRLPKSVSVYDLTPGGFCTLADLILVRFTKTTCLYRAQTVFSLMRQPSPSIYIKNYHIFIIHITYNLSYIKAQIYLTCTYKCFIGSHTSIYNRTIKHK